MRQLDDSELHTRPPNKRLKLPARVDWGMNLSSARRSLKRDPLGCAT
jgi:hypothetical protein